MGTRVTIMGLRFAIWRIAMTTAQLALSWQEIPAHTTARTTPSLRGDEVICCGLCGTVKRRRVLMGTRVTIVGLRLRLLADRNDYSSTGFVMIGIPGSHYSPYNTVITRRRGNRAGEVIRCGLVWIVKRRGVSISTGVTIIGLRLHHLVLIVVK